MNAYNPGPASGAHIEKDGENWTLVVERILHHSPGKVWTAITDPEHIKAWAPYEADRNLGSVGTANLTTAGTPEPKPMATEIVRAEAPHVLEFSWAGQHMIWQLEPYEGGTKLTLWHNINRKFIAMGAAGWHICFDVLDASLGNNPIGRMVAGDALQFEGWQRLNREYSEQFGIEVMVPQW